MLDDVASVRSDAVEVGFIFDGFSQSENSKERIVQLMSDSSCESPKAARFLGLDELILETAVIGRIPEDKTDPILSLVSPRHVEPLIVIPPGANLNLLSIAWFLCSHHGGQRVTGGVNDRSVLCPGRGCGAVSALRTSEFFSQVLSYSGIDWKYVEQRDRLSRVKYGLKGVASDPIDVPHLFVLIDHDDRGWDCIQDLVRRVKQGLHLLCFNGHLIGQACKGGLQLAVHSIELVGQILKLIAGLNVDGLSEFTAPDQLCRSL
jgi:hypothetical protein